MKSVTLGVMVAKIYIFSHTVVKYPKFTSVNEAQGTHIFLLILGGHH